MRAAVLGAIERAARYVVDMQGADGAWNDFSLGVGRSDAWTTAYIGTCLLAAEPLVVARERRYVRAALERAAAIVRSLQRPDGTWGYNRHVPPDSDSTSWATLFLRAMGGAPAIDPRPALRSFARADGGFATYEVGSGEAPSTWTHSHPDVTPLVVCALGGDAVGAQTVEYIVRGRRSDGCWNSYWYRSPLYATLHNLRALEMLGRTVGAPAGGIVEAVAASDPFELALMLEIVGAYGGGAFDGLASDALAALLAAQSVDGWWASAPFLRVTSELVERPWECSDAAVGALFADEYFLFTTATVVAALRCVGAIGGGESRGDRVRLLCV